MLSCNSVRIIGYSENEELKNIADNEGYINITFVVGTDTILREHQSLDDVDRLIKGDTNFIYR